MNIRTLVKNTVNILKVKILSKETILSDRRKTYEML